ncbi:MAG: FMN-binding protein [Helcococcus sp.]|nr:FMN-binding protein [Helcococcus sp.]
MKFNKKSLLYSVVYMIVLAAVLTFFLALINLQTKNLVERNVKLKEERGLLYVLGIKNDSTPEDVVKKIEENVEQTGDTFNDKPVYVYKSGDEITAYAFTIKGSGLWGPIEGIIGITPDFKETTGIDFLDQSETPGLGGRISEDQYKEQYRGAEVNDIRGSVDVISGATGTSNSVYKLVDTNIAEFVKSRGGN